jgi:hypothetical protein
MDCVCDLPTHDRAVLQENTAVAERTDDTGYKLFGRCVVNGLALLPTFVLLLHPQEAFNGELRLVVVDHLVMNIAKQNEVVEAMQCATVDRFVVSRRSGFHALNVADFPDDRASRSIDQSCWAIGKCAPISG